MIIVIASNSINIVCGTFSTVSIYSTRDCVVNTHKMSQFKFCKELLSEVRIIASALVLLLILFWPQLWEMKIFSYESFLTWEFFFDLGILF